VEPGVPVPEKVTFPAALTCGTAITGAFTEVTGSAASFVGGVWVGIATLGFGVGSVDDFSGIIVTVAGITGAVAAARC